MKPISILVAVFACMVGVLTAAEKPTLLSAAQLAIDANMKTPEGKDFDQRMGNDFIQKHREPLRSCKQAAGSDLTSFWILLKLNKDGTVEELLLYPTTKLGTCAREGLLKEKFLTPPRPDYWVGVFLKISH